MMTGLAIFIFVAPPLALLWLIADGLKTGAVRGRGGPIARSEYPIMYWVALAGYLGAFGACIYFICTLGLDIWRSGLN